LAQAEAVVVTESEKAMTKTLAEMEVFGVAIPQAEQPTVAQQQAQALKALTAYMDAVTAVEVVEARIQE